jgi:hypothetical protein
LTVTDLNMRNPYCVPLSKSVDALDPDPEAFAAELANVEAHESYGKARYRTLKGNFAPLFRRFVPNRAIVETGLQIRQQREIIQDAEQKTERRKRNVQRRASELGLSARTTNMAPEADEGTRLMLEAKRLHAQRQGQKPESTEKETI